MALSPGTRLGPYELVAPIGAGGMGEVYRAKDTRLDRTVAVKVLPPHLSSSLESRQRFEREAKTISQLSHPHICALYDVGNQDGVEFLVMEYLEGETLSDRLLKGALPFDQVLRYGIEIADALDKAHRQGIVHRDLKPGNVMITKSGVKLLDFGLAKAVAPAGTVANALTALPTQATPVTHAGTVLGTFQYMAPEQLEGKDTDTRTDIFAFGAVLYEMATGRKAFSGGSQASLISSIMGLQPPAISTVTPATPPAFDRVVGTCLAKDPEERWQSAADVKRELRWIGEGSLPEVPAAAPAVRRPWLPWTITALAVAMAAVLAIRSRGRAPTAERMQLSIVPREGTVLTEFFDLSPDGKKLAFIGFAGDKSLVRIRDLGSDETRELPGTDSADTVFWSPDGRSLAFVARGKLRRIELATGSIDILCDASVGRGGDWGPKGEILFPQKSVGTIYRVPASGGSPVAVTTLEKGDVMHRWPQFLPDGRRFLYFSKTDRPDTTGTYLASLDAPGRKLLVRNGATGVFVRPGTLLFGKGGSLIAQRLDLDRGELTGEPETVTHPIIRGVMGSFRDLFAVSNSGIVVFRAGSAERQLKWVDRHGDVVRSVGSPGVILNLSLCPGDHQAGFTVRSLETGVDSVWIADFDRDVMTPFVESAYLPTWDPDGGSLFYGFRGTPYEVRRKWLRAGQKEESIGVIDTFATPHSISPDGRYALFTRTGNNFDVGVKDLQGNGKPLMLLSSPFCELQPHFSPDGRWFVYSSDELGQSEIFVRRFPMTEEKWRISNAGGQQPSWRGDGKEIFFLALDDKLMAATVSAGSQFSSGAPQPLFSSGLTLEAVGNQYAASADGQRFLMAVPTQGLDSSLFRVLLNWRAAR